MRYTAVGGANWWGPPYSTARTLQCVFATTEYGFRQACSSEVCTEAKTRWGRRAGSVDPGTPFAEALCSVEPVR